MPPETGDREPQFREAGGQQGARLDERFYVGALSQTLSAYEADTGRPAVPPPSELELIKWRDVVDGPAQVLEDVTRLQAAKMEQTQPG